MPLNVPDIFLPGKLAKLGAVMLLVAWGGSAAAQTDRARLEKWCTHGSAAAAGSCFGYLLAAKDALSRGSIEGIRACLPEDVTLQELHQLVLIRLQANPEGQSATALELVARAYAEKYPCSPP